MSVACCALNCHRIKCFVMESYTVVVGDCDRTCSLRFVGEVILCRHHVGAGAESFRRWIVAMPTLGDSFVPLAWILILVGAFD